MTLLQERYLSNFYIELIIALVAGALLPFAFAPFHLWPIAILSPAILLYLWQLDFVTVKRAFCIGFIYGLAVFGLGVSWVFVSIHRYGNTDIPLAAFITAVFILLLSFFPGLQGLVLKRFNKGNLSTLCLVGFPSSWVLFEWFRGIFLTGFPWLFLGYSQLDSPLRGFAPISSVYAVSLAVALSAGALVLILLAKKTRTKVITAILLMLVWGGGQLLSMKTWVLPYSRVHKVALVQGNVSPLQKFGQKDPIVAVEENYGRLTKPYLGVDLILWPESAIPLPLPYAEPYIKALDEKTKQFHSTLITGIQVMEGKTKHYNSLIAVGMGEGTYHKQHLLPFGDFLPFESHLRGLINFFNLPMSSFSSGRAEQKLIIAGDLKLSPAICYEIAFPELQRDMLREAQAIVTLSEDGWFGDSFGPHQHLQIARMRALELGRPILRATTSGITAVINAEGKITHRAVQFEPLVLAGEFQPMTKETPWQKIGLWPLLIILLLGFLWWICFCRTPRF